jgi:hypothetical protein
MMRYELIHGVLLGPMVVLATTFVTEERRRFLFESLASEGASQWDVSMIAASCLVQG